MELKFLGRGSSFNVKEGNTSAYFIEGDELFLIDCGENIFERIITKGILKNVTKINVFITHLHPDHAGSLGSLILYSFFTLKTPVNIIYDRFIKNKEDLIAFLMLVGCTEEMYNFVNTEKYSNKYQSFQYVRYFQTIHCPEIPSYSICFVASNKYVYYTGDTCDVEKVSEIVKLGDKLDKLYVDTTSLSYPGNVHIFIGLLNEIVPENLKHKVYCMHINCDECIKLAKKFGFNVVENV